MTGANPRSEIKGGAPANAERLALKQVRQNRRAFDPDGFKRSWIEAEELQDSRGDLTGFYEAVVAVGGDARVRNQEHHVGVVMGEAAVLGLLL